MPPLTSEAVEAERRNQQIEQIRDYFAKRGRLHNVAFRIRAANRDECKNRTFADIGRRVLLGATVWTDGLFTRELGRAGRLAFSVDFEREADYVGAYYTARAGYDLVGAEEFWRTYSLEIPDSTRAGMTHPVTPVRFVQLQKVIAEIADKRRRNMQLIPELKVADADTVPMTPAEDTR